MPEDVIAQIASESCLVRFQRQQWQRKSETLQKGLLICQQYSAQSSLEESLFNSDVERKSKSKKKRKEKPITEEQV